MKLFKALRREYNLSRLLLHLLLGLLTHTLPLGNPLAHGEDGLADLCSFDFVQMFPSFEQCQLCKNASTFEQVHLAEHLLNLLHRGSHLNVGQTETESDETLEQNWHPLALVST